MLVLNEANTKEKLKKQTTLLTHCAQKLSAALLTREIYFIKVTLSAT